MSSRPNFFIVGAMKSGTSTLYEYLQSHPQIFMSKVKEPSYFVDRETLEEMWPDMAEMGFWRGEEFYLELFADAGDAVAIGEASTNYSKLPRIQHVAERIAAFEPAARIIYIMRDPVERTISHYWHNVKAGVERRPLERALRDDAYFREVSHYAMQLRPYYANFGTEHVLPLLFEDLRDAPLSVAQSVYAWLGVEANYVPADIGQSYNVKPERIEQVRGGGLLRSLRYSKAWSMLGPAVPPAIRALGRRLETRPVEPKAISTDAAVAFLRPIQQEQTRELAELTGLTFEKWATLHG